MSPGLLRCAAKPGHSRYCSKRQIKDADDVQGPPRAGGKDVYVMFPAPPRSHRPG